MTDYEQEQVTTHILGPLVQHVVESLACLIWEFTEQAVYEGVHASKLEARQGPFAGQHYDNVSLCRPQLKTNSRGECENLEFSTNGFKTIFKVDIVCRALCDNPNRELTLSARLAYIDPYTAWRAYTDFIEPAPDYILDEVLTRTNSFIKLIVHTNRIYALFSSKLLVYENQTLLVRLRPCDKKTTEQLILFHDFLVLPNGDLIVVLYFTLSRHYEIKHLQF